ncbi:MAG: hypothetical protein AAGI38_17425 [Bacteroidota bacterium]
MNLQYVSDSSGKTTGVFIPIEEWSELKEKFARLEAALQDDTEIPEGQKAIVRARIQQAKPEEAIPWEAARKQITFDRNDL